MNTQSIFTGPFTLSKWRKLGEYLNSAYIRGGNGVTVAKSGSSFALGLIRKPQYEIDTLPPFWVTQASIDDEPAVVVWPGMVYDQATPSETPLEIFAPENLFDENKEPKKHPIKDGQAVFVRVHYRELGKIGRKDPKSPKVEIFVGDDETKSIRYQPANGETPEIEGERYYKLAKFIDEKTGLEMFLAGSHIVHLRTIGRNLNLKITNDASVFLGMQCWRDGLYVGTFADEENLPPHEGEMDSVTVARGTGV